MKSASPTELEYHCSLSVYNNLVWCVRLWMPTENETWRIAWKTGKKRSIFSIWSAWRKEQWGASVEHVSRADWRVYSLHILNSRERERVWVSGFFFMNVFCITGKCIHVAHPLNNLYFLFIAGILDGECATAWNRCCLIQCSTFINSKQESKQTNNKNQKKKYYCHFIETRAIIVWTICCNMFYD